MKFNEGDRVKKSDADDPRSIPAYRSMRGTVTGFDWTYVLVEWDMDNGIVSRHRPEDLVVVSEPHVAAPLWALVAIDHKGWPALIVYGPVEWWDEFMAGDGFADVFDAKLPEEAGVYWWHGHYRANPNAGHTGPNGEVDDWPGEWVGKWTKQELPK